MICTECKLRLCRIITTIYKAVKFDDDHDITSSSLMKKTSSATNWEFLRHQGLVLIKLLDLPDWMTFSN